MDKITLVIFGASGDLASRKMFPALFHMFHAGQLPENFSVVGVSRRKWTNSRFKEHMKTVFEKHHDICSFCKPKLIEKFLSRFSYCSADISKSREYPKIKKAVHSAQDGECSNLLFYMAVPPRIYTRTLRSLKTSGILTHCEGDWARVIIEKPIGWDLSSFYRIKKNLGDFKKDQIYLIDHYLGKDVLKRIPDFRRKNDLLRPLLNGKFVKKIEVRLWEKGGVDERGPFYEKVGALRDVGQNHVLEMLALVLMDLSGNVHKSRTKVLNSLSLKGPAYRAQYIGFSDEKGIPKNSTTETFFRLVAESSLPEWRGVPIVLSAGKGMGVNQKQASFDFGDSKKLIFSLSPEKGIKYKLLSGSRFAFVERSEEGDVPYVEEYQRLLFDAIEGKKEGFVSLGEVEASWKFLQPVINSWKRGISPLEKYEIGKVKSFEEVQGKKEIGIVGLGKMGGGLAKNLIGQGWRVVGFNRTPKSTKLIEKEGLVGAYSLEKLVSQLSKPRVVWLMIPAGKPIDDLLFDKGLVSLLDKGDIVIDGGNSYYKDSIKRSKRLAKLGIKFLDVGVSGGPGGARNGACLMIGGRKKDYVSLIHLFKDLSVPGGFQFFRGHGAGHFVKMVHNGIEYGMMQAIAEGFTLLKKAEYKLDLSDVARVYNQGSVIESRLVRWLNNAFTLHTQELRGVSGKVGHTGEGAWTVKTAKSMGVKTKVIEDALNFRLSSRDKDFTGKVLASLREQFGGHSVR